MRRITSAAWVFGCIAFTRASNAQSAQLEEPYWYGWQVLAADAASITVFAVSARNALSTDNSYFWNGAAVVAGGGYFFGAPFIHLAHHRLGGAAVSLGLHVGLPLLFGELGNSQSCPSGDGGEHGFCGGTAALVGGALGVLTATIVDATVNSTEPDAPGQNEKRPDSSSTQWGLAPALSADGKHGELRLFGTF